MHRVLAMMIRLKCYIAELVISEKNFILTTRQNLILKMKSLQKQNEIISKTKMAIRVVGIFLGKNNHEYEDKKDIVVTPNNPLDDVENPDDLRQKYIDGIVDDDE